MGSIPVGVTIQTNRINKGKPRKVLDLKGFAGFTFSSKIRMRVGYPTEIREKSGHIWS